ncbi:MAG TPA: hypothetical protein VNT02_08510 [Burkholderiales bacterium]|nr:hypothetical protein [Burkholderiales bacterium]
MYGEISTPEKRRHQRGDITGVSGITSGTSRDITVCMKESEMRASIDSLVFTLVVIAAFVGLWADTVRGWLAW